MKHKSSSSALLLRTLENRLGRAHTVSKREVGIFLFLFQSSIFLLWIISAFSLSPALTITRPSSPSSHVILSVPHLSVRLHLQDAVISLAWLDVYCEAEIENGL